MADVERFMSDFAPPQYPWPDSLGRERFVDIPAADRFTPKSLRRVLQKTTCFTEPRLRSHLGVKFHHTVGDYT